MTWRCVVCNDCNHSWVIDDEAGDLGDVIDLGLRCPACGSTLIDGSVIDA